MVSLRSGFAPARLRCRSGAEGDAAPERSPISLRMATERAQSPLYQSQFNYFLAKQKRKEKKRLEGNEKMKSGLKGAVCKFSPIQNMHNSNLTSGFDPTHDFTAPPPQLTWDSTPPPTPSHTTALLAKHAVSCSLVALFRARTLGTASPGKESGSVPGIRPRPCTPPPPHKHTGIRPHHRPPHTTNPVAAFHCLRPCLQASG